MRKSLDPPLFCPLAKIKSSATDPEGTAAREHVRIPFPYLGNGWTDCTEIWCVARGPVAMHFTQDGRFCTNASVTVTHLSTSIRSRSFIAQKALVYYLGTYYWNSLIGGCFPFLNAISSHHFVLQTVHLCIAWIVHHRIANGETNQRVVPWFFARL